MREVSNRLRLLALLMVAVFGSGCASHAFVTVNDGRFILEGRHHLFVGVNFWQAVHMAISSPQGNRTRLQAELDHLQDLGVSNIRILAAFEGPGSEPYRVAPAMMTEPGQYNAAVMDGLDFLIAQLGKRDMHAVVALTNFWEWSGGMAQYVAWHDGSAIPYPATHDWRDFCDYAARFYEIEQCQAWFHDHIRAIIERVNPYTRRAYRDEPAIFAWELANEPRYYPQAWIDDTARFIQSLDSNHMITTGSEGEVGGDFIATHQGEFIDYGTLHIWPQNWGWFDPVKPETFTAAERKARQYFQRHVNAARRMGKPLVLEEFGLARDWEPRQDCYDPKAPTTLRDRFFAAMFGCVLDSASTDGPVAGSNIWVWSGGAGVGTPGIGDPPHEKPGWYSVYRDDHSTLALIRQHAADLSARRIRFR